MIFIWGKKPVYRRLGFAADFCPVCRSPRAFAIRRVGMAGHVYYLSAGEGTLVGYDRTCTSCGTQYDADPERYVAMTRKPSAVGALARATFPGFKEFWAERLALEERVRKAPFELSTGERRALILEPFITLSPKVEQRCEKVHLDMPICLAIAGTIALANILPALAAKFAPLRTGDAMLAALAIGFTAIIWQLIVSNGRYVRRTIMPLLASSLRPLRPTEAEIRAVVAELGRHGHKIGKKLDAAALNAALKRKATPA